MDGSPIGAAVAPLYGPPMRALWVLALLILGLLGAAPAHAANVFLNGGSITVEEPGGNEDNSITIDYGGGHWTVTEANSGTAPLTHGSGCTGNADTVTCDT